MDDIKLEILKEKMKTIEKMLEIDKKTTERKFKELDNMVKELYECYHQYEKTFDDLK